MTTLRQAEQERRRKNIRINATTIDLTEKRVYSVLHTRRPRRACLLLRKRAHRPPYARAHAQHTHARTSTRESAKSHTHTQIHLLTRSHIRQHLQAHAGVRMHARTPARKHSSMQKPKHERNHAKKSCAHRRRMHARAQERKERK